MLWYVVLSCVVLYWQALLYFILWYNVLFVLLNVDLCCFELIYIILCHCLYLWYYILCCDKLCCSTLFCVVLCCLMSFCDILNYLVLLYIMLFCYTLFISFCDVVTHILGTWRASWINMHKHMWMVVFCYIVNMPIWKKKTIRYYVIVDRNVLYYVIENILYFLSDT